MCTILSWYLGGGFLFRGFWGWRLNRLLRHLLSICHVALAFGELRGVRQAVPARLKVMAGGVQ